MSTSPVESLHPTYFELGDTVQVRHLPKSPPMVVKKKFFEGDERKVDHPRGSRPQRRLERILCYWFNLSDEYVEKDFDYKDLVVLDRARNTAHADAQLATA